MAVIVRDLYFSYTRSIKKPTLNGINATVENGCIYALLGPSGCGKTTLLDIIIGRRTPKCGTVLLYGYKANAKESGVPGEGVGYMPQDIALQFDLTINEILIYFGTALMMDSNEIRKESQRLLKAFHLPEKERLIGRLSGGQKRLVSLAVALLHKPRLLILDEPTVGVDPLLRISFWNHLLDLSVTENVTTIITTHYIDEAKRANVVAFMRKGEILSEGNPQQLMQTHGVLSLDDVFLTLCTQQGHRRQSLPVVVDDTYSDECIQQIPINRSKHVNSLKKFFRITLALIWKHFIEVKRNPSAVGLLFLMTFVSLVAMTIVFGGSFHDLPVAWVVEDINPLCDWHDCVDALYQKHFQSNASSSGNYSGVTSTNETWLQSDNFDPFDTEADEYTDPYLPDFLKQSINKKIITLIDYNNIEEAIEALTRRTVYAVIHLKSNFSTNYLNCDPFLGGYDCEQNETIESGSITLYPDVSNAIIFDTLRLVMYQSIIKFRTEVAKAISILEETAKPPFSVQLLFGGTLEDSVNNLQHFATAGFLVIFQYGFSAAFSILSLLSNDQNDINVRNYASGVNMSHVIIAEIIVRFTLLIISSLLNLYVTLYMFNVPCRGSMTLVICLLATQVLLGITHGIQIATMVNKSLLSFFMCAFVLTFSIIVSGSFWSVEAIPVVLKQIVYCLPYAHSVNSMRTLMFREYATFYPQIAMGFIMSFAWIAFNLISTFVTIKIFKK